MGNYKLTLSYEGTRYSGWQRQGNTENTIQRKVEDTLSRLLEELIQVNGCGRTDAGVHARMQVCSFLSRNLTEPDQTLSHLREYLPEDIGAISLEAAPPRFHARLSCTEKTYRYRLWLSETPNVFERRFLYSFPASLDLSAMQETARLLEGTHDFAAFCAVRVKKSTVRTLRRIEFLQNGSELDLCFTGDGFLYRMVRILTGTLLEAGLGRLNPAAVPSLFEKKDRSLSGFTAPAKGLTLWEIRY